MPGYKKKAPAEANAFPYNRSSTTQFNDLHTTSEYSALPDSYRAAQALLAAIPGMNRRELHSALRPLTIEHLAPGPQQVVFTAVRGIQHHFPVRSNRIEALTLIQSRLIRDGSNGQRGVSDLIVDMATAPPTTIPSSELCLTVRIETASRKMHAMVSRRIDGDLTDGEAVA